MVLNFSLCDTPGPLRLTAYFNANWVGDITDHKSTTGICVYFGNNPIMWSAKKQPSIS